MRNYFDANSASAKNIAFENFSQGLCGSRKIMPWKNSTLNEHAAEDWGPLLSLRRRGEMALSMSSQFVRVVKLPSTRNLRRHLLVTSLAALLATPAVTAGAGQLVYQPVNPAFGGNPLNGSFILGEASANNYRYTQAPGADAANSSSTAQQFSSEITSALLSQVAAQIGNEIIGPNAKDSGTFNVGGQIIQFNRSGGQININLTDSTTGGTTNIQIPVPNF